MDRKTKAMTSEPGGTLIVVEESLDNSIPEKESSLHDLISIGMKFGRLFFFNTSYTIESSKSCESGSEFEVKNHRRWKHFLRFLHLLFALYVMIPFFTEGFRMSSCSLVNWLKKGQHVILVCWLITADYCLEIKGRRLAEGGLIPIYRQCVLVQSKFKGLGIHLPARSKVRAFGWSISIATLVACIVKQCIFASASMTMYSRNFSRMMTLGLWVADNVTVSEGAAFALGSFGVVLDGLLTNYWIFGQVIHFFLVVTIWMVFYKLNEAWKSGQIRLPEIIDLHFQSTKLLKAINDLMAPLTFWSVVFNIAILCFWTNYMAIDFRPRPTYIVGVCNFVKVTVELMMAADVNWKAHRITEWLEESCATTEKFPLVDPVKLSVFTTQVYNQDSIGFRGLNYFVVTSRLAITIVGIVITYSVAVNQFCHST